MTPWIAVWLLLAGLVTVILLGAGLVALVRHGISLGRTVGRFSEEVGGLANEISREAATASARASGLSMKERSKGRR